jgi:hypothetical protein
VHDIADVDVLGTIQFRAGQAIAERLDVDDTHDIFGTGPLGVS